MKKMALFFMAATIFMMSSCSEKRPVLIVGSSCMGELSKELSKGWEGDAEVQLGGTALGISALLEGRADIAACSRELSEDEEGLFSFQIATDAIAVAVNPKNDIAGLTSKELAKIYTGDITDWSQLGMRASPIVVIGRESGSGTRSSFESALGIKNAKHSQELPESGMIRTAVAALDNSIGYFSLADADESVKLVSIDGAVPDKSNIASGKYPITRPFLFLVREGEDRKNVMSFIDYSLTKGRKTAEALGYQVPYKEGNLP
ncbi:MAG: phosphate ABC transporter substrate-binding protein [Oscillospiraceae bacterium]|nr:phosphate ABC transporter substrate-binding protein [Oscillospiraceae bacterium]